MLGFAVFLTDVDEFWDIFIQNQGIWYQLSSCNCLITFFLCAIRVSTCRRQIRLCFADIRQQRLPMSSLRQAERVRQDISSTAVGLRTYHRYGLRLGK